MAVIDKRHHQKNGISMQRISKGFEALCAISLIGMLAACGGGGGSNSETSAPTPTTYHVGGTVSGVPDDETVSLQNSNGETVVVGVNGSFSFPTQIAPGSSYAVKITQQPTWASCSISNSGGTASSDVSAIIVSCQPAKAQVTTLSQTGATYQKPNGLAMDASGTLYVSDSGANAIFTIASNGQAQQWAGGYSFYWDQTTGTMVNHGYADGQLHSALFNYPAALAIDNAGNLIVADAGNSAIRQISAGVVGTIASDGSGDFGFADGPAKTALFDLPYGLTIDHAGNIYVADSRNTRIRKITPAGVVSTIAGSGAAGSADGTGSAASFTWPRAIAMGPDGNIYVSDTAMGTIRKVTPDGVVTTLAGSGTPGYQDGIGKAAMFANIDGIAIDKYGTLYVADTGNNVIRRVSSKGVVTTLAGSGQAVSADGIASAASFNAPQQMLVDQQGNIYVVELMGGAIRKISPVQ